MKDLILKLFYWIKDRFLIHFVVFLRLHIGRGKKQNPELRYIEPDDEDIEIERKENRND